MTPRYWLRICAGALLVFAIGMVLVGMTRRGTDWVDNVANSATTISIPIVFVPFRLDGADVGSIKRLDILRDAPDQVTGARVAVKLQDAGTLPAESCALAIDDLEQLGEGASFYCATPEARQAGDLIPFGTVEFEPGGATRTFLMPLDVVQDLEKEPGGDIRVSGVTRRAHAARIREAHAAAQHVAAQANDVEVRLSIVSALERAGLLLRADSNGAALRLYDDASGDAMVMRADSNGFVLSVKEAGEARMQMRADSNGLQLHISEAAAAAPAPPASP